MSAKSLEDSFIPKYQQVADDIRASVSRDVYRVGQKIPSEPELSSLYDVSRITVRKAIETLCEEGLLVKRQGKGTFVQAEGPTRQICDDRSTVVRGFSSSCRENGFIPGAKLLRREVVDASDDERVFFGEACAGGVIAIDRIRTADGRPIMVEYNTLPVEGFAFLRDADLDDVSLFELISERTGRVARRSDTMSLSIQLASEELARILEVPVREPLFHLVGHYLDQEGAPLYVGDQYIIGSRYTFSM